MTSPMHHGARLSLLGLRSNLPTGSPPPDRTYRIGPGGKLVSEQEVLEHLASAPKPLGCSARVVDGVLEVITYHLPDSPHELAFHRQCIDDDRSRGGFMGFLLDRYKGTPETLQLLCAGREEAILLPLSVIEQWRVDYSGFAYSADDVANPRAAQDPVYIKARALGAVGVVRFSPPSSAHMSIHVTLDPPIEGEDLEVATRRCIQDAKDFRGLLWLFVESQELRSHFEHYAQECRRFFGTQIPTELADLLSEWEALKRGPAASPALEAVGARPWQNSVCAPLYIVLICELSFAGWASRRSLSAIR